MINLIIFGGRGNGTVLLEAVIDINNILGEKYYNIIGFINNQSENTKEIEGYPVLGDIIHLESLLKKHDAYFINCISSVKTLELVEFFFDNKYRKLCNRLISIVHPNSFIGRNVRIGEGCFIGSQNYIGQNTSIGKHCFIHSQCYIARDCQLSDYNYFAPKVYIGAEVKTKNSVYFGVGSMVKEHITIGNNSVIGMGAIIVNNIGNEDKYFGEKARKKN